MKILALRGENLASLQHKFEIDFAHGRLGEAGLFAITGKTGAGKSTLLDAICLALYDRIPRLQSNKKNDAEIGRDDDASRIKANDVRSILSRGKAEGFAEVDFVANDGSHWRAHWHVRRARGRAEGRIQASEQWLENLETCQRFAGKKQELQAEMERLIGLSFEQFRRAVMLPQGEFAAFLKAGADERAALLERMTGGEIYGQLSVAAYERAREEKQKLTQLQEKLGEIALLSDEDKQQLNTQIDALKQQLQQLDADIQACKKHQQALQTERQLTERITATKTQLLEAQAQQQAAKSRCEQLEQIEKVQPVRGDFTLLQQIQQRLASLVMSLTSAQQAVSQKQQDLTNVDLAVTQAKSGLNQIQQQWAELEPKLKKAAELDHLLTSERRQRAEQEKELQQQSDLSIQHQQALDKTQRQQVSFQQQKQQIDIYFEQNQGFKAVAEQYSSVRDNLEQYLAAHRNLSSLSKEKQQIEKDQQDHALVNVDLDKQLTDIHTQRSAIEGQLRDLSFDALEQAQTNGQQQLSQRQQRLDNLRHGVASLKEAASYVSQVESQDAERQMLQESQTENEQRLAVLTPQLNELKARRNDADSTLQQSRAVLSLSDYRDQLKPEEACPLCGSHDHPYASEQPVVDSILNVQQQHLNALTEQLRQAENEHHTLQQQLPKGQESLAAIDSGIAQLRSQVAQILQREQALLTVLECDAVLMSEPNAASLQQQLEAWQQAIDQEWQNYQAVQKSLTQHQAQMTQARQQQHQLQQLQQSESTLKETLYHRAQVETQWQTRLQSLQQQTQVQQEIWHARDKALNEVFGHEQWLVMLRQRGEAKYLEQLNADVECYHHNHGESQTLEKQLAELAPALATLKQSLQAATDAQVNSSQKCQQLSQTIAQLWQQRCDLIGEQGITQLEENHKAELVKHQAVLTQEDVRQRQAGEALAMANANLASVEQQQTEAQNQQQVLAQTWQAWQQKLNLNHDALTGLLSKDDTWISQERTALKTIEQAVSAAQTLLVEREQAVIDHQPQLLSARQWLEQHELVENTEQQAQQLVAWDQQKSQQDEQLFQLRQHADNAEKAEQQAGDLKQKLIGQQEQTELWLQMSELIGSATGNKFRTLAQGLTLQQLVILANEHLQDLAPRYALQPVPGSPLALQVIDHDMGDEVRSVESLSGGESFLVSLALALALASLAADTRQLGSLFIDEGFGTLDPDSLEMALACLDALQADGRQIGVISHVGTMVERIGVQVAVEAQGGGRSQISIRG